MPRVLFRARVLLLSLAVTTVAAGMGLWWWHRPPPEPIRNGQRLSEWLEVPGNYNELREFEPDPVPWLTHAVEHGEHDYMFRPGLPLDRTPMWLLLRIPQRWGGMRRPTRPNERLYAAYALRMLGPKAAPATAALGRCLEGDNEPALIPAVAQALHAIGPSSWPVVEDALEHGNPWAKEALISEISIRMYSDLELTPAPEAEVKRTAKALIKALRSTEGFTRMMVVNQIGGCHSDRPEISSFDAAIPELVQLLWDPAPNMRAFASGALGTFAVKAEAAIARLIELLADDDPDVRKSAARTLGSVDIAEKRSVATLRTMLRDDSEAHCRKAAGVALKALGISAEEKTVRDGDSRDN